MTNPDTDNTDRTSKRVTSSRRDVSRASASSPDVALASTPASTLARGKALGSRSLGKGGWKVSERAGWRRRRRWGAAWKPPSFRFWSRRIDARCPSAPVQRVQCLARAGRSPRGRGSWPWPSDRTPTTPAPTAAAAAAATHPPSVAPPSTSSAPSVRRDVCQAFVTVENKVCALPSDEPASRSRVPFSELRSGIITARLTLISRRLALLVARGSATS